MLIYKIKNTDLWPEWSLGQQKVDKQPSTPWNTGDWARPFQDNWDRQVDKEQMWW